MKGSLQVRDIFDQNFFMGSLIDAVDHNAIEETAINASHECLKAAV